MISLVTIITLEFAEMAVGLFWSFISHEKIPFFIMRNTLVLEVRNVSVILMKARRFIDFSQYMYTVLIVSKLLNFEVKYQSLLPRE